MESMRSCEPVDTDTEQENKTEQNKTDLYLLKMAAYHK